MADMQIGVRASAGELGPFVQAHVNAANEISGAWKKAQTAIFSGVLPQGQQFQTNKELPGLFLGKQKGVDDVTVDFVRRTFTHRAQVTQQYISGFRAQKKVAADILGLTGADAYMTIPEVSTAFVAKLEQRAGDLDKVNEAALKLAPATEAILKTFSDYAVTEQVLADKMRTVVAKEGVNTHQMNLIQGNATQRRGVIEAVLSSGELEPVTVRDAVRKRRQAINDLTALTNSDMELRAQLEQDRQAIRINPKLNPAQKQKAIADANLEAQTLFQINEGERQRRMHDIDRFESLARNNPATNVARAAEKARLQTELSTLDVATEAQLVPLRQKATEIETERKNLERDATNLGREQQARINAIRQQYAPEFAALGEGMVGTPPIEPRLASVLQQYPKLAKTLQKQGLGGGAKYGTEEFKSALDSQGAAVTRWVNNMRTGVTNVSGQFAAMGKDGKVIEGLTKEWTVDIDKNGNQIGRWGGQLSGVGQIFRQTIRDFQKVIEWTIATSVVFGGLGLAVRSITGINELNAGLQRFSITAQTTKAETTDLFSQIGRVAQATATPINEMVKSADDIALATKRAGQSTEQWHASIISLTQAVGILTNLAGIDTVKATDLLTASFKQLNLQPTELIGLLNKVTAAAGGQSTAIADIIQAVGSVSEASKAAGMSIDEMIASVQVLSQATSKTPADVATAFKNLFGAINSPASEKFLKGFGIQIRDVTGGLRPYLDIMKEIYKAVNTGIIPENRVQDLLRAIAGGPRRAPDAAAMLSNIPRIESVTAIAANATNDALIAQAKILDTNKAKITQFQNAFSITIYDKFSKAVEDATASLTGFGKNVLGAFDSIQTSTIGVILQLATVGLVTKGLQTSFKYILPSIMGFAEGLFSTAIRAKNLVVGLKELTYVSSTGGLRGIGSILGASTAAFQASRPLTNRNPMTGQFVTPFPLPLRGYNLFGVRNALGFPRENIISAGRQAFEETRPLTNRDPMTGRFVTPFPVPLRGYNLFNKEFSGPFAKSFGAAILDGGKQGLVNLANVPLPTFRFGRAFADAIYAGGKQGLQNAFNFFTGPRAVEYAQDSTGRQIPLYMSAAGNLTPDESAVSRRSKLLNRRTLGLAGLGAGAAFLAGGGIEGIQQAASGIDKGTLGTLLQGAGFLGLSLPSGIGQIAGLGAIGLGTALQMQQGNEDKAIQNQHELQTAVLTAIQTYNQAKTAAQDYGQTQSDLGTRLDELAKKTTLTSEEQKILNDLQIQYAQVTIDGANATLQASDALDEIAKKVPELSGLRLSFKAGQAGLLDKKTLQDLSVQLSGELLKFADTGFVLPEDVATFKLNLAAPVARSVPNGPFTSTGPKLQQQVKVAQDYLANSSLAAFSDYYGQDVAKAPAVFSEAFSNAYQTLKQFVGAANEDPKAVQNLFKDGADGAKIFSANMVPTRENILAVQNALAQLQTVVPPEIFKQYATAFQNWVLPRDLISQIGLLADSFVTLTQAQGQVGLLNPGELERATARGNILTALKGVAGRARTGTTHRSGREYREDTRPTIQDVGRIAEMLQENPGAWISPTLAKSAGEVILKLMPAVNGLGNAYDALKAKGDKVLNQAIEDMWHNHGASAVDLTADYKDLSTSMQDLIDKNTTLLDQGYLKGLSSIDQKRADLEVGRLSGEYKDKPQVATNIENQLNALDKFNVRMKTALKTMDANQFRQFERFFKTIPGMADAATLSMDEFVPRLIVMFMQMGLNGDEITTLSNKIYNELIPAILGIPTEVNISVKLRYETENGPFGLSQAEQDFIRGKPGASKTTAPKPVTKTVEQIKQEAIAEWIKAHGNPLDFSTSGGGSSAAAKAAGTLDIPKDILDSANWKGLVAQAIADAKTLQGQVPGAAKEAKGDIVSLINGMKVYTNVKDTKEEFLRKSLDNLASVIQKQIDLETKADVIRRIRVGSGDFAALANAPMNSQTGLSLSGQGPITIQLNINGQLLTPAQLAQAAEMVGAAVGRKLAAGA